MNFEQARFNMVEQQIRPWDVLDFDVLDALSDIPREAFVLPEQQAFAYADMSLPLPNGSAMLEPKVVARLIQSLHLTKLDTVVEIGTGSGWATAVLAKLAGKVISIDLDASQQQRAATALQSIGIDNVEFRVGDGLNELISGDFSAIYVGGSCPTMPENLRTQLQEGAQMTVIVGEAPVMRALHVLHQKGEYISQVLFDTVAPALSSRAMSAPASFRF